MRLLCLSLVAMALLLPGCNTTHKVTVEPIEVKPIHMTVDINLKVDRQLDDFFDFEEEFEAEAESEEGGRP
jgi:hypothetical protein